MPHQTIRILLFITCTLLSIAFIQAQTCGQLFWTENFGTSTGQTGSPNPNVNTNYSFQNFGVGSGNYGIMKAFSYHGSWHVVPEDHTPNDIGGNFMVIDGDNANPIFYSVQINNLPLNTAFEFSGWAMNIDKPSFQSNLTFAFRVLDPNGNVIATTNTGIMPATENPIWTLHEMTFNSGNNSSITLQLQFTATGYDDFAFDDFALVQVGEIPTTQINQTLCDGQSLTVGNTVFNAANPSGTVTLPSVSKPWCDSTIIVYLTFGGVTTQLQDTLCAGESITVGNTLFNVNNPSGTVVLPSVSNPACDSIIMVNLTFGGTTTEILDTLCSDASLTIGNEVFDADNPSGTVVLPSVVHPACDSTIIVNLTFGDISTEIKDTLCFGDSLTIGNKVFNANNPTGTVILPSIIYPTCDSTIIVNLVFSPPIILEAGIDQTIELGQSATLSAFINPNYPPTSIIWTPDNTLSCNDCLQTKATPTSTTTYQIEVNYSYGCSATDALTIQVVVNQAVYIPNSFSPDTKEGNNFFTIFTANEAANINILQIYDRWGNLVFEKSNFAPNQPLLGWDGTFRGKPAQEGVYVYYARVGYLDGSGLGFKGDVMVVR